MNQRTNLGSQIGRLIILAALVALLGALLLTTRPAGAQDNGTIEFPENSKDPVAIFTDDDPEGDMPITWSVPTTVPNPPPSGFVEADFADRAEFSISSTGVLTFSITIGGDTNLPPDFENPQDTGADNTYSVVVQASDPLALGPEDTFHKVVVEVTNVDEDGVVTWTVDPDGDGALMPAAVNGGDPILQFQAGAQLVATVTDGDITGDGPDNDADNADDNEVVNVIWRWYRSSTNSSTGGTLIEGANSNTYTVQDKTGSDDVGMYLRAEASYTDGSGPVVTASKVSDYPVQAFRTNNATPNFGADTSTTREVYEGMSGIKVGAPVTATDDNGDVLSYTLFDENGTDTNGDSARFKIDQKTGQITTNVNLNYEGNEADADNCAAQNACVVTVRATDSAGAATDAVDDNDVPDDMTVTITLKNVNEKPTFGDDINGTATLNVDVTSKAILENAMDDGLQVANYTATDMDAEDTVLISLRGDDAAMFQLADDTEEEADNLAAQILSFKDSPNYEDPKDKNGDNIYEVIVRASDRGNLYDEKFLTVRVRNVDEDPDFMKDTPTSYKFAENGKEAVATFKATDPEGAKITWSRGDGDDMADFSINPNTGALSFAIGSVAGASPDFENPVGGGAAGTSNTYTVTVGASDDRGSSVEAATATLTVTVEVTEVAEPGRVTWSVDPAGADAPDNTILGSPNKPLLQFQEGAVLNATATDGDINPDDVSADSDWQWYRSSSSSSCGTNALSGNGAESREYTVQAGDVGSYLCAKASYSIGGSPYSAEKISEYKVGRNLEQQNANPTFGADTSVARMVYEGPSGMMVGDPVTATDADSSSNFGDQLNYTLTGSIPQVGAPPVDAFRIDQKTGQITTNADLNYDGSSPSCGADRICTVMVRATDSAGAATDNVDTNDVPDDMSVEIAIKNVNEKPTFTAPTGTALRTAIITPEGATDLATGNENVAPVNITYTATDMDDGDTAILVLEGPDKDMFQLLSSLDGLVLSFTTKPDYENPVDMGNDNRYNVIVRATDGTLHADLMIAVNVTDENEAPDVTRGGLVISESSSANGFPEDSTDLLVATYTASGPMASKARWSREGDDAGDFTIQGSGESVMLKFGSARNYEAPTDKDKDNVYMVTLKADDGTNTDTHDVRVTVTNVDEPGTVTGLPASATVGDVLTAMVEDDDGATNITWQWARAGTDIDGAASASYTVAEEDAGMSLEVTATYVDVHGSQTATSDAVMAAAATVDDRPQVVRDYDTDGTQGISITELFNAIDAYFDGVISIDELFEIIDAYFG